MERAGPDDFRIVTRADKAPSGEHQRKFNKPCSDEVAMLMVAQKCDKKYIILQRQDGCLQKVAEPHNL